MTKQDLVIGLAAGIAVGAAGAYYFLMKEKKSAACVKPCVLPAPKRVVEIDGKLSIDEHVGNASSGDNRCSIASVKVSCPMDEAVQVPGFDEYVLVTKGTMRVYVGSADKAKRPAGRKEDEPFIVEAKAGEVLQLPKGHLYRYNFPESQTAYIPICLPAFSPEIAGRIE